MTSETSETDRNEKVLLIRSAPSWLFEKAIENLRSGEGVVIDVYCPKSVTGQLAGRDDINEVIDDNWDGFFKKSCVTKTLVEKLAARKYDHVLLLYNDTFGEGYGPLRKLAFKIRPGKVSSMNINQVISGLKNEGILGRFFLPRKWFYNIMVVMFAFEILFVTIWETIAYRMKKILRVKQELPQKHKRLQ